MSHLTDKFKHLKIPLETIKSATDNFADKNCIGRGGFGKVYKGQLLLSRIPTNVAIKRLDPKFGQGNPEFWKEIITLSTYKHENIVSLIGFCDESGEKILIYEYVSKGSLNMYLNTNYLKWATRLKICIGAARGLAYLHDPTATHQRVLHRDIKSSNILLDECWKAKISDLGLSKFGPANQEYTFLVSNPVGTFGYCDPLYVETGLLTKESDVYSFGVVLFEVLCGRLCIDNSIDKRGSLIGLVRQYYKKGNINDLVHSNIKDEIIVPSLRQFTAIAYQCLSRDFKERPTMTKVVSELEIALQHQDYKPTWQDLFGEPSDYIKLIKENPGYRKVIERELQLQCRGVFGVDLKNAGRTNCDFMRDHHPMEKPNVWPKAWRTNCDLMRDHHPMKKPIVRPKAWGTNCNLMHDHHPIEKPNVWPKGVDESSDSWENSDEDNDDLDW